MSAVEPTAREPGPERRRSGALRVGSVPYLVGRPLDEGLEKEPSIELVRRVPAELVAMLRAGELDVALVSSIELFRAPGYRFLEGLAVAGDGFVASVQVFLRGEIESVRTLALDPSSRAAAALVRVLFERRIGGASGLPRGPVELVDAAPGTDVRALDTDAWLRIGDPALREWLAPDHPPVFNPSAAWRERTGLPFVFACWIVRPGVELEPAHVEAFARSRERGTARRDELAREAAKAWSLPIEACRRYLLEECRYDPGSAMRPALRRFRDEAAAIGLCDGTLDPDPIEIAHVT
jgi:chorismate dehydratase